jgi:hypothetical protein
MAQVRDIVRDALGHLRVLDAAGNVSAIDMRDALRALNLLGARWAANGLLPSWTNAVEPTDTLTAPEIAEEPLSFNLALRLRPRYGTAMDEDIVGLAGAGVMALWRDRIAPEDTARTVGNTIFRALRLLVQGGTFPDAFTVPGALLALNAMLQRWEANGLALGWSPVAAIADDLPAPPEADEAISTNLAVRLQPEYGAQLSPVVMGLAEGGLAALRRDVKVANPMCLDRARGGYDIRTDSYE